MSDVEFNIQFSDLTMKEADGVYSEVAKLMEADFPHPQDWCLRTKVSIESEFGLAEAVLQLNQDAECHILEYSPSVGDVFYNPDIQVLSVWAQENGWNTPEPTAILIEQDLEFWRHFWDTLLIDSRYLDELFGERETSYDTIEYDDDGDRI